MNQGHNGVKTSMQVDQENSSLTFQQAFMAKQTGNAQNRAAQGMQNLSNPMIIDKKYNLNAASRQSFNVSMQNST